MRLRAACRVKGVWTVVQDELNEGTDSELAQRVDARTAAKREKASGIIISALGDAPLRVVIEVDDNPSRMLALLDARYALNRTVSRIAVQTQLFRMSYKGQNMSEYIDQYTSLFAQLERMGKDAAIPESHKAPMLLASIDPDGPLESTAAALRTKEAHELTWEYVATTLIDEYNARSSVGAGSGGTSKNRGRRKFRGGNRKGEQAGKIDNSDEEIDIEKAIHAFSLAMKSSKGFGLRSNSKPKCNFCGAIGHVKASCYMNPENPNNGLPPELMQKINAGSKEDGRKKESNVEFAGCVTDRTTVHPPQDSKTYADSGASTHLFHDRDAFVSASLGVCSKRMIILADRSEVSSSFSGEVIIPFDDCVVRLKNVLHVPKLGYNLVSTGRMADNGIESHFRRFDLLLKLEDSGTFIGRGVRCEDSGMYTFPSPRTVSVAASAKLADDSDSELWHRRLAHINFQSLVNVHKFADGVPKLSSSREVCRACEMGKAHKLPFPGHFMKAERVGQKVHSDIVGKIDASFPAGSRYICTFLDDFSRFTFVTFLRRKSDVKEALKGFVSFLESSQRTEVRSIGLHSDGALEYKALPNNLGGIKVNKFFSAPYTPEHNGIAERINRTIMDAARSLLIQADLPVCLWPFAVKQVLFVRNRVPHSATGQPPITLLKGERPELKHVRVFGSAAFVLQLPRRSKLEHRAKEGVLLESVEHGVYKVLVKNESDEYSIRESRHVTFDETRFPGAPDLSDWSDGEPSSDTELDNLVRSEEREATVENEEITDDEGSDNDDDDSDDENSSESSNIDDDVDAEGNAANPAPPSRYPTRQRRPPGRWYVASTAQTNKNISVTTSDTPTLREAMSATPEEQELWRIAIDDELNSLNAKMTWKLDQAPASQPLPTHVILKVKRNSDGSVERFKARIVAGGNFQIFGESYMETYALVVSFTAVRIFLYIALEMNMYRAQLDVKTAFLNGNLSEDIWVRSPHGIASRPSKCYKLMKAIYGLKQAHLAWHRRLCSDLSKLGFAELSSAPCVFMKRDGSEVIFLLVYVDDVVVLSSTSAGLKFVTSELRRLYEIRVSDSVNWFLGVKLQWVSDPSSGSRSLALSQPLHVESVLRRFGLERSRPVRTPMVDSFWTLISAEQDKSIVDAQLFQQMIGSLLYLALRTRFDILPAVSILSRFQKAPTEFCHRAAKHLLRYLRGSTEFGITYTPEGLDLNAFVDSDYAGDVTDRKSMSGYFVKLGSAPCSWASKKQRSVALSTCEAEFYALTDATKEVIWIR